MTFQSPDQLLFFFFNPLGYHPFPIPFCTGNPVILNCMLPKNTISYFLTCAFITFLFPEVFLPLTIYLLEIFSPGIFSKKSFLNTSHNKIIWLVYFRTFVHTTIMEIQMAFSRNDLCLFLPPLISRLKLLEGRNMVIVNPSCATEPT